MILPWWRWLLYYVGLWAIWAFNDGSMAFVVLAGLAWTLHHGVACIRVVAARASYLDDVAVSVQRLEEELLPESTETTPRPTPASSLR